MLFFILILLFIFILIILFIPSYQIFLIKKLSLFFSIIIFILSIILWILFNNEIYKFIYIIHIPWFNFFNIYYTIGIDGISIFFIILTTFLISICILISWNIIIYRIKEFILMLLIIEFLLINVFSVLDLVFFYIFFESILIPMFIIIGIWGMRQRKIHAAYQFFFYTLIGSIIMLLGILSILFNVGTTDIQILTQLEFTKFYQIILLLSFLVSFAVKIPMFPVHIWLPEAHVEAPTAGSVILAGILLKLGTYGIIRFVMPIFNIGMIYIVPFIFMFCLIAIIYSSLTTIRQIDLKKIIAYSSVAHMNFALLGLFVFNIYGLDGSIYLMLGHGVVSSALFLSIGMLYDRYHTRNILYYGGLVQTMPIFSIFFLLFTLTNVGLPGTVNFIGELLILIGVGKLNFDVMFLSGFGIILGVIYAIWLYNRLIFGPIKIFSLQKFQDLSRREINIFIPFIFLIICMGIFPNFFLNIININSINYIFINNEINLIENYSKIHLSILNFLENKMFIKHWESNIFHILMKNIINI